MDGVLVDGWAGLSGCRWVLLLSLFLCFSSRCACMLVRSFVGGHEWMLMGGHEWMLVGWDWGMSIGSPFVFLRLIFVTMCRSFVGGNQEE